VVFVAATASFPVPQTLYTVKFTASAQCSSTTASAAVGIDHADDAEFWQHIGGGAGVYTQRMHSNVSLAEQQQQPVWAAAA
jgi:hypothetical protein